MTVEEVKAALGLQPHPREGGWFTETFRSGAMLSASVYANSADPVRYEGPRRLSTAIYYMLEPGNFSEMHRLASDEIFHHYAGSAVEMLQLWPDGHIEHLILGKDLPARQRPQVVVPKGVWQGSRLLPGEDGPGTWALLGCTVSPGFEYADYETGTRAELTGSFPAAREMIYSLTRQGVH